MRRATPGRGARRAVMAAALAYPLVIRRRQLRWGASDEERVAELPGDELLPQADLVATRAIAIPTTADRVWPWIAQIGQERGGFYTYDVLENLVGCGIHSADQAIPEWQDVAVGDSVRLHPTLALVVAAVDRGRALVLRGAEATGHTTVPYDFTWAFVLRQTSEGWTRLLVRERYRYLRWWAPLLAEPVASISFVMSQKMLRGIRDRAMGPAVPPVMTGPGPTAVDLYWIPLGAGRKVVRISGTIYEAVLATVQRRPRGDLYHSALVVSTPEGRHVIEVTPIPSGPGEERGVVGEGPVGTKWARSLRVFRYEVRSWRNGVIPDIGYAVGRPVRLTDDAEVARQVLDLVPHVPTPVWGRDELHTGDMWNSNSVTAWLLAQAGLATAAGPPPVGGRAPGWEAGLVTALRSPASVNSKIAA